MPCDISLLESDGSLGLTVSLDLDDHWALFGQATSSRYKLLAKLGDYYADANFCLDELRTDITAH